MLSHDVIVTLARRLYDARKARTALRHFSQQFPAMTIEDGYAIQREWVELEPAAVAEPVPGDFVVLPDRRGVEHSRLGVEHLIPSTSSKQPFQN